jgi:hypothetical protein
MHRLVESIAKTSESNVDIVQTAVVRTLRAILTSPNAVSMKLLALRSTFHVYLVTKLNLQAIGQRGLVGHASIRIFFRMEAYDVMARGQARKIAMLSVTQNPSRSTCRLQVETQRQPRPQKWKVQPPLSVSYGQRIVGYCARCVPRTPVDVEASRIHGRP